MVEGVELVVAVVEVGGGCQTAEARRRAMCGGLDEENSVLRGRAPPGHRACLDIAAYEGAAPAADHAHPHKAGR